MTNFNPKDFKFHRVNWSCWEPIWNRPRFIRAYLEHLAPNGQPFPFEAIFSGEPSIIIGSKPWKA